MLRFHSWFLCLCLLVGGSVADAQSSAPTRRGVASGTSAEEQVDQAQFRVLGRPGVAAQQQQQRRATEDDQPASFTGAMPPAPKVPGITIAPGTKAGSTTEELVDQAIKFTTARRIDTRTVPPWAITHAVLASRKDLVLYDNGKNVNGVDWICNQARFWNATEQKNRGLYWFEATPHGGRAQPFDGTPYEFEGHVNQTLALLAMSNLPKDHKFVVAGGKELTMQDMIRHAQMNTSKDEEITWTLWFLIQYLDPDTQWTNVKGQKWSIESLVQLQTQAEVTNAPCGGTHGLFTLAYARNSYLRKHGKLQGIWLSADMKVQQYIEASKALQNTDGSFSTMFYKGRGHSQTFNERIKSSGHILEMLMMALPQSRLKEDWVQKGVRALARDMVMNASQPGDCGPLYHSLHALNLYKLRMASEPSTPAQPPALAQTTPPAASPNGVPAAPVQTPAVTPAPEKVAMAPPIEKPTPTPAPKLSAPPATPSPIPTPTETTPPALANNGTSPPRPLPVLGNPTVILKPIEKPTDPAGDKPLARPVPDMPQAVPMPPQVIASGKPEIDAAPLEPKTEKSLLTATPTPPSIPMASVPPVTPDPMRIAMANPDVAPQPRLLTPAPITTTTPRPAPGEPTAGLPSEASPPAKAVRVTPGMPLAQAPTAETVQPTPIKKTDRIFVPLSPAKLKELKEQQANPVPEETISEPETAPLLPSPASGQPADTESQPKTTAADMPEEPATPPAEASSETPPDDLPPGSLPNPDATTPAVESGSATTTAPAVTPIAGEELPSGPALPAPRE